MYSIHHLKIKRDYKDNYLKFKLRNLVQNRFATPSYLLMY